jgi:hypothetical protein
MQEANQSLPLSQSAIVKEFPYNRTLDIRLTYSAKLREVREMGIEDVIQELAIYKAAESLKVHCADVAEVCI